MIQEFRDFVLRGNVVDLAVAVVIGAAFGAVVASTRRPGPLGGRHAPAGSHRTEGELVDGFKKFLLRGNVVDLAVAVVIGAAFGAVVTSFVSAFITPLVGVFTGATGDVSKRAFTAGGATFPYGAFVDALLSFVIIAAVVYFLVVQPVQRLMDRFKTEPDAAQTTKQCRECLSSIPTAAIRCAFCTVEQVA